MSPNLNALLAHANPWTLWSNMAFPPNERGGLYMMEMLNFVIMMLNGLFDFAIVNVLKVAMGFFCYETNAPGVDFHLSLPFAFFLCLCSMILISCPSHVLERTNFLGQVIPFLTVGFHSGFHLAIPLLVILSEGPTVIFQSIRFVRHVSMFLIYKALMWIMPLLFLLLPNHALQWFCYAISKIAATGCNSATPASCRKFLFFTILLCLSSYVMAADAASSSGFSIPKFNGTRIKYNSWYTEFCGWIAMKYPDLVDLIEGDWEEPDAPADANDHDADDTKAFDRYWSAQRQLYGALVNAVPAGLRQALAANAKWNGVAALELLQQRFGVVDAHDRASALARVSKSYISNGSGISLKDATRQLDRMQEAHTEFTDAGGDAVQDEVLKSYFLRAFPASYNQIKMAIRTMTLDSFDELTEAFLRQVKNAEDDHNDQVNQPALGAQQGQQDQQQNGAAARGGGRFGGGRFGRGRGGGRGGSTTFLITCLRCGLLGHDRRACTQAVVQCIHCMADHLSALCPRGPGGTQRDALTPGARTLLDADVQRAARGNAAQPAAPNAQPAGQIVVQNGNAAAAQQQMAALMQQMQQMQQQMAALAAPAPPAVDPAHAAQAMQQLYPQNMGAHAQQHGLYVLQTAPPISLFNEIYVRGLMHSFGALLQFFGALCAVVTRARGGGGVCCDDDFADFCYESNDTDALSYESNDDFADSTLAMVNLHVAKRARAILFASVLFECTSVIMSRHWPVERRSLGLPDSVDFEVETWPDSNIWGAKQLAYLECVWRDQIRSAIAQSDSASPRQLSIVFSGSAFSYEVEPDLPSTSLLATSRISPLPAKMDLEDAFIQGSIYPTISCHMPDGARLSEDGNSITWTCQIQSCEPTSTATSCGWSESCLRNSFSSDPLAQQQCVTCSLSFGECMCFRVVEHFDAAAGLALEDLLDGADCPELFYFDSVIGDVYYSKVVEHDKCMAAFDEHKIAFKSVLLDFMAFVERETRMCRKPPRASEVKYLEAFWRIQTLARDRAFQRQVALDERLSLLAY